MRVLAMMTLLAAAAPLGAQSAPFDAALGAPLSAGQWSYARTAAGSEARFGNVFAIECRAPARLVVLRRIDAAPPAALAIATDLMARALPASGTLGSADPLLDAIAFSRGRFVVASAGAAQLVLPASPEAARSIEDCRN